MESTQLDMFPRTPIEAAAAGVIGKLVCWNCQAERPANRYTCQRCFELGIKEPGE